MGREKKTVKKKYRAVKTIINFKILTIQILSKQTAER